jgi:hypothetical protein
MVVVDKRRVICHSLSLTAVELIISLQTVPLEVAFEGLWQRPVVGTHDAVSDHVQPVCCKMDENVG